MVRRKRGNTRYRDASGPHQARFRFIITKAASDYFPVRFPRKLGSLSFASFFCWQPQLSISFSTPGAFCQLSLANKTYHGKQKHIICEQKHIICERNISSAKRIMCEQHMSFANKTISSHASRRPRTPAHTRACVCACPRTRVHTCAACARTPNTSHRSPHAQQI